MHEMELRSELGSFVIQDIEKILGEPVISYDGRIHPTIPKSFVNLIEIAHQNSDQENGTLFILLRTAGGYPEGAQRMVETIRYHFSDVTFIVDDYAMSAGTMIALSGNTIMMNHSSSLGPIDPQLKGEDGVSFPIGGYLDGYYRMREDARNGKTSVAEDAKISNENLAKISEYESAIALSRELVTEWLVHYKFSDWDESLDEKKRERAEKIAEHLSDFKKWHSHGRPLGLRQLDRLGIEIVDYYKKYPDLQDKILYYRRVMKSEQYKTPIAHSRYGY